MCPQNALLKKYTQNFWYSTFRWNDKIEKSNDFVPSKGKRNKKKWSL